MHTCTVHMHVPVCLALHLFLPFPSPLPSSSSVAAPAPTPSAPTIAVMTHSPRAVYNTYMYNVHTHIHVHCTLYMYTFTCLNMHTCTRIYTCTSRPRQLSVFFTVCLRTLPYLLSLLAYFPLCIYMYEIDHVHVHVRTRKCKYVSVQVHVHVTSTVYHVQNMYTSCSIHVHAMYSQCTAHMYMYIHVCARSTVHCTCTLVTCTRSLSSLPNALSLSASTSSKCLTLPSILSTDRVAFISLSLASPSLACHSISLAAAFFESFRAISNSWRLDCCSSSWANLSWEERQGGRR